MTPADLLTRAMADGLLVWPQGTNTIRVRGPAAAQAKWLDALRRNKRAILHHLWVQRLRDYFQERAGILERDARLLPHEAEEEARLAMVLVARKLGAPSAALREALAESHLHAQRGEP
jgi:hypothetical protein